MATEVLTKKVARNSIWIALSPTESILLFACQLIRNSSLVFLNKCYKDCHTLHWMPALQHHALFAFFRYVDSLVAWWLCGGVELTLCREIFSYTLHSFSYALYEKLEIIIWKIINTSCVLFELCKKELT